MQTTLLNIHYMHKEVAAGAKSGKKDASKSWIQRTCKDTYFPYESSEKEGKEEEYRKWREGFDMTPTSDRKPVRKILVS